ncbi:hypothetical protein J3R30DRAFT_1221843 [Lentinula aciculospora]|uniref:Uncharacterized protein n=1 Tax=Lentinula aciculospora TaxID=153920 RepID=A0A9W9DI90_9AGAR|nr:hypothetical protein J3R30DRAFT_1221843 [Lentinula aciculospora]
MSSARDYIALSTIPDGDETGQTTIEETRKTGSTHIVYYLVIIFQTLIIIALALRALRDPPKSNVFRDDRRQILVYSPAKDVAIGQPVSFNLSPEDPTMYRDAPSVNVDEIWRDLYKAGISYLTHEEQTNLQLVGADAKVIAGRPDKLIQLAVFHDMHCVNKLRQRLHQDYYTEPSLLLGTWHMDHCIDALRQTVMCSGDITPIVWRWDDAKATAMRDASMKHQCRNFNKVKDWAIERVPEVK